VRAPAGWHRVDLVSDLHLSAAAPATLQCFLDYLAQAEFDALFILGDLFEVWVGDDVLSPTSVAPDGPDDAAPGLPDRRLAQSVAKALHARSGRTPVYVMHGNRDFLLGPAFESASGCTLLEDPCVLDWHGSRYLLSHGDAWCLDDRDYMHFRAQVRSPAWQAAFLAQPLASREAQARAMRAQSRASQNRMSVNSPPDPTASPAPKAQAPDLWADVDSATARQQLADHRATTLIHGHTHRPAEHDLGSGLQRWVLSDWDADARPPRAEALSLHHNGRWQRRALTG
jgi:UDP-2,3-diacylglucosamine hydrolase